MRHRSEEVPCAYCVLCVRAHPPVCMCAVFVSKEAHSQVSHKHAFLPLQHADKRVLQSAHDGLGLGPRGVGECHIRHFVIAYDSRARGEEYGAHINHLSVAGCSRAMKRSNHWPKIEELK